MTYEQANAQAAEMPRTKRTQYQRIVEHLERFDGHIHPMAAIHGRITTKLSTRLGEMNARVGVTCKKERDSVTGFVHYRYKADAVQALHDYYIRKSNA